MSTLDEDLARSAIWYDRLERVAPDLYEEWCAELYGPIAFAVWLDELAHTAPDLYQEFVDQGRPVDERDKRHMPRDLAEAWGRASEAERDAFRAFLVWEAGGGMTVRR